MLYFLQRSIGCCSQNSILATMRAFRFPTTANESDTILWPFYILAAKSESLYHVQSNSSQRIWCHYHYIPPQETFFFCFDNRGTFHDQILRTLHGDLNLRALTALQLPASGKFRVSSVARFEPRTMCYLLGPHFPLYSSGNILMVPELFMELHKCH